MAFEELKRRWLNYIEERSSNQIDRIRVVAFVISYLTVVINLVLHYIMGTIGPFFHILIWVSFLLCTTNFVLYLKKKISVEQAFMIYGILGQTIVSTRMIALAVWQPENYHMLIIGNQMVSYTILLYMTLTPKVYHYVVALSLATLIFVANSSGKDIQPTIGIYFASLEIFLYLLIIFVQKSLEHIKSENASNQLKMDTLMAAFGMNMKEMNTYVQVCMNHRPEDKRFDKDGYQRFFDQLSDQSLFRLTDAVKRREWENMSKTVDLAELFPKLTPTELKVCRMVVAGKTLSEIAQSTNKTSSNISTVRGNIRKKLMLKEDEDLRTFLMEKGRVRE